MRRPEKSSAAVVPRTESPPGQPDMRDAFFDELYRIARRDRRVMLLAADMGAYAINSLKQELPNQYVNVGVAEQNLVSLAAGLALGGKIVFIYSIIPFATMRCYEQIKFDLCCMNLPVSIIGTGPGFTYGSDGPTHHATQDIAVMRTLPEITILNPSDSVITAAFARIAYKNPGPTYVRIEKGKPPLIHSRAGDSFSSGLAEITRGRSLAIISTGIMVHDALAIADRLNKDSVSAGVIDLYRIKPLNEKLLLAVLANYRSAVTLEENSIVGGIGTILSEVLSDSRAKIPLKRIALPHEHCFRCGTREELHEFYGLDAASVKKSILQWVRRL